MSHTLEQLTQGLDPDFQQVITTLQEIFVRVATKTQGRATHTYGVAARGQGRIVVPFGFPKNDFLKAGNTFGVILRHSSPGAQKDNRARDGAASSIKFYQDTANPASPGFHDITMNTGRTLFVRTARAFLSMVTTPNPDRPEKLLKPGILNDAILSEGYRSAGSFSDFYYHSQICYELRDMSGSMSYMRYRMVNADRGPERGNYPASWQPKGETVYPPLEGDLRSADYLKQDFLTRFEHDGVNYLLQCQLRGSDDTDAVDCTSAWDPTRFPWIDLAEIRLTEALTDADLDVMSVDADRTHESIALPLATTGIWPGPQADNYASLGHARALVYALARRARADAPLPHVN
jgi:catalase